MIVPAASSPARFDAPVARRKPSSELGGLRGPPESAHSVNFRARRGLAAATRVASVMHLFPWDGAVSAICAGQHLGPLREIDPSARENGLPNAFKVRCRSK